MEGVGVKKCCVIVMGVLGFCKRVWLVGVGLLWFLKSPY